MHPLLVLASLLVALALAACAGRGAPAMTPAERDAAIRQIAQNYSRDRDLAKAQAALGRLNLANPTQFVVTLAEQAVSDGRPAEEVIALARLAEALGGRSPKLQAYLAPTAAPTLPAATATGVSASPTPVMTATPIPPTATSAPPTPTPTATATPQPAKPRVVADNEANLRGGPGTNNPVIGQLRPGVPAAFIGYNTDSTWINVLLPDGTQGWVSAELVEVIPYTPGTPGAVIPRDAVSAKRDPG
ncbi:MAG: SH3 domain-containing protein, partial [Anaerolineae bacterium]